MKNSTKQMTGYKPSQFAPVVQSLWAPDIHISTVKKGCKTCAAREDEYGVNGCNVRWDYMREQGGGMVECWRPPGSILVWGENSA